MSREVFDVNHTVFQMSPSVTAERNLTPRPVAFLARFYINCGGTDVILCKFALFSKFITELKVLMSILC